MCNIYKKKIDMLKRSVRLKINTLRPQDSHLNT